MTSVFSVLPRPRVAEEGAGSRFRLSDSTTIYAPAALASAGTWLQSALRPATGFSISLTVSREGGTAGDLSGASERSPEQRTGDITMIVDPDLGAEDYRLEVTSTSVRIAAGGAGGAFYAAQTVLQLLPPAVFRAAPVGIDGWTLPTGTVEDGPKFGWRGVMLDVSRYFMPKHDVLRFIDLAAMHKLNRLHLHLADDQGWRVEILKYPRLTEIGAWRRKSQVGPIKPAVFDDRPHGGFYTQDDLREIVAYAAARNIVVVPEIDVPGHSQAAIAAYPELGISSDVLEVFPEWGINPNVLNMEESTVRFYQDVFDEIMDIFPGPFIGVGGDECPRVQWESDPRTQELMRERGMTDAGELEAWFIQRLGERIVGRGRRVFGWDELLEGDVPSSSVVASWRGMAGALTAARRGYDVVACPEEFVYLDYRETEREDEPIPVGIAVGVKDIYQGFDPVPGELTPDQATHILGGQANVWVEHMDSPRTVDFKAFPRLCAVAEVLWSDGPRDWTDFQARLATHLRRLDAIGVEYHPASGPQPWHTRPGIPGKPESRAERAAHIAKLTAKIATP